MQIYASVAFAEWKLLNCSVCIFHIRIYKNIYVKLEKSNKHINAQVPTNLCIFDSWGSILELNFCLSVVNLVSDSVKKIYSHEQKTVNWNVQKLNDDGSHTLMQKIAGKKTANVFLIFDLVGNNIFFLAVGYRTPHRAFKICLKPMHLGYKE